MNIEPEETPEDKAYKEVVKPLGKEVKDIMLQIPPKEKSETKRYKR